MRETLNNYFCYSGGSVSNALGSIAVVYSSLYILMSQVYEEENEAKTCATGALTGIYSNVSAGEGDIYLRCTKMRGPVGSHLGNYQNLFIL